MTVFWLCATVTTLSAFISAGFSLEALKSSGGAQIAAMYGAARSVALAIASLIPLFNGSHDWLAAIALAMVIVQALDTLVGIRQHDVMKTAGPAALTVANAALLVLLVS